MVHGFVIPAEILSYEGDKYCQWNRKTLQLTILKTTDILLFEVLRKY
jgi:hypothetical protein